MPISLFIEHHDQSIAFYINGDLQFDTADEAIYHEHLVIPAVGLAIQRFPHTDLHVLICGGGDGLALRDVLRFEQVKKIDLVDYSSEVIELGKTIFKPYNLGSLESEKVTIHVQEALRFVSQLPDNHYHIIICDFTYPHSSAETQIYSREWFQEINRVLIAPGIICTNGVSPEQKTTAFWCLYQTILAADFMVKPLQLDIPSFKNHGYGHWGFLLASVQVITREEIETIYLPDDLNSLNQSQLLQAFFFANAIAHSRHNVLVHTIDSPQLLYYLLNAPVTTGNVAVNCDGHIDFLDVTETATTEIGDGDFLDLESVTKFWLENIYAAPSSAENLGEINRLIPARHHYHNPKMTSTWLAYIKELLAEIDTKQLLNKLLARASELPPQTASELKKLAEIINHKQPLPHLSPRVAEFITMLSVTLLMANLVAPDSVFAKGSSYSSGDDYSSGDGKFIGFIMTVVGGYWLATALKQSNDE
ncbi:spermine synthase [Richelia sinica]|nr:spermine synthase [Richelia sinica]MBD2663087.1 spermine synthase [Richelia sinica FACHB-800]